MNRVLSTILIFGFLGMAVFGFLAMEIGTGHHNICIAAIAKGQLCMQDSNPAYSLMFHAEVFKSFSRAVLNNDLAVFSFFILLLILFSGALFGSAIIKPFPALTPVNYGIKRFLGDSSLASQPKILYWLALRENSPTFLFKRRLR